MILTLLKEGFPGSQALREQVSSLAVRPIEPEGSLQLETSGPRAHASSRMPVEATLDDTDGETIYVLLHVVDGLMNELEVSRGDFGVPKRQLATEELRVFVPEFPEP